MSNYYNKNAIPIKSISPTLGLNKTKEYKKKLEIKNRNKSSKDMFKKKFNKGGRVGLKGGTNLGMQSVKYGLDNNPKITAADPKAKFIAANKKKKSKSPMDKTVRKA